MSIASSSASACAGSRAADPGVVIQGPGGAATSTKRFLIFLKISTLFFALNEYTCVQVHGFSFHHSHRLFNNDSVYPMKRVSLTLSRSHPVKSFFSAPALSSSSPSLSSQRAATTRRPIFTLLVRNCPFWLPSSSFEPSSSSLYYKSKDDDNAGDEEVIVNSTMKDLDLVAPPPSTTTRVTTPAAVESTLTSISSVSKTNSSNSRKSKRVLKSSPIQNLITIDSLEDFTDCIHRNREKVVVARFFASWCKTCKQSEPYFFRFARKNPNIVFINIPFSPNNKLFEEVHVKAVPYGHVYHSEELVKEMSLTPKHFSDFEKTVKNYYLSISPSSPTLSSSTSTSL